MLHYIMRCVIIAYAWLYKATSFVASGHVYKLLHWSELCFSCCNLVFAVDIWSTLVVSNLKYIEFHITYQNIFGYRFDLILDQRTDYIPDGMTMSNRILNYIYHIQQIRGYTVTLEHMIACDNIR